MKPIIHLLALAVFTISFGSCKKVNPDANVTIEFNHKVGSQHINIGSGEVYTTGFGQKIKVNLFRYYVHNARLVNSTTGASISTTIHPFRLIDAADPTRLSIDMGRVANANFNKLRLSIGIPADRNHTGAQTGDLDPTLGMIWTWSTGYIFTKVEGKYFDNNNVEQLFSNHYANDGSYITEIELPIDLDVNGKNAHIALDFDLAKLYKNIDLNTNAFKHSDPVNDELWLGDIKNNYMSVFSVSNITYDKNK